MLCFVRDKNEGVFSGVCFVNPLPEVLSVYYIRWLVAQRQRVVHIPSSLVWRGFWQLLHYCFHQRDVRRPRDRQDCPREVGDRQVRRVSHRVLFRCRGAREVRRMLVTVAQLERLGGAAQGAVDRPRQARRLQLPGQGGQRARQQRCRHHRLQRPRLQCPWEDEVDSESKT